MSDKYKKIIEENNLYKRLLEFYIENYGPPENEILLKFYKEIENKELKEQPKTEDIPQDDDITLIDPDLIDYLHLHILSTKDYVNDANKYLKIISKMTENVEKLINDMKNGNM